MIPWKVISWIRYGGFAVYIAGVVAQYPPGIVWGGLAIVCSLCLSFSKMEAIVSLLTPDSPRADSKGSRDEETH